MAITARLGVDFGPFYDAVQKAQVTLKGFEAGAGDVSKKLDAMANSFSGQRIFQQATLAQKAIEEIGGVTQLTAKEQQRLNTILGEALQKYTVIGQKAPAGMQEVYNQTRKVSAATQTWAGQVNSLMGALGVGLSVGGVVAFGKSLLEMGDQLVRVADRTGLTTIEVQKLQFIAGQSGNTIDELTGAIGKLQKNLTTGDQGTVAAVKQLGLSFAQLKTESPYQQMADIATAIAKVDDPAQRATLAIQLFGRTGAAILPSLISQFAALGDAAPVMSDKTVRALDTAGDGLAKFGLQVKVWAAETYNLAGRVFDRITAFALSKAASLTGAITTFLEIEQHIPGVTTVFNKLGISTQSLREYQQQLNDQSKLLVSHLDDQEVAVRKNTGAMVEFEPKVAKATKAVKEHEIAVIGIGSSEKFLEDVQRRLTDASGHYYERLEQLIPVQREWWNLLGSTRGEIDVLASHSLPAATGAIANLGSGVQHLGDQINQTSAVVEKQTASWASHFGEMAGILDNIHGTLFEIGAVALRTGEAILKNLARGDIFGAIVAGATGLLTVLGKVWGKLKQIFGGPSDDELAAREKFAESFSSASDAIDKLGKQFADVGIDGETARKLIQALFDATHVSAEAVDAAMKAINDRIARGADTASTAIEDATKRVDDLNRSVRDIPKNPFANWDVPGGIDLGAPSYGATGGMVTQQGIQAFARGGRVLPFRGTDTVPAMLTPGEMVLTRAQQQAAFSGGGGAIEITLINQMDGRETSRHVTRLQSRDLRLRRRVGAA